MPTVGKKHFPYTDKGMKAALAFAEKTGQKVKVDKKGVGGMIKKYAKGGMLRGPSHKQGGISAVADNQPLEMEGGEFVIKKDSANKLGPDILNYINKNGTLPKMDKGGSVNEKEGKGHYYVGGEKTRNPLVAMSSQSEAIPGRTLEEAEQVHGAGTQRGLLGAALGQLLLSGLLGPGGALGGAVLGYTTGRGKKAKQIAREKLGVKKKQSGGPIPKVSNGGPIGDMMDRAGSENWLSNRRNQLSETMARGYKKRDIREANALQQKMKNPYLKDYAMAEQSGLEAQREFDANFEYDGQRGASAIRALSEAHRGKESKYMGTMRGHEKTPYGQYVSQRDRLAKINPQTMSVMKKKAAARAPMEQATSNISMFGSLKSLGDKKQAQKYMKENPVETGYADGGEINPYLPDMDTGSVRGIKDMGKYVKGVSDIGKLGTDTSGTEGNISMFGALRRAGDVKQVQRAIKDAGAKPSRKDMVDPKKILEWKAKKDAAKKFLGI